MNSPRTSRVLQLLTLVATNPEPTRLKDISAALGVHPSMVSRMVADLIDGGFLSKSAYRSVTATPLLAVLGRHAGENHPLTQIARQELHSRVEELKYSCEFATVTSCGLFHFYKRTFGTPAAPPGKHRGKSVLPSCAAPCLLKPMFPVSEKELKKPPKIPFCSTTIPGATGS